MVPREGCVRLRRGLLHRCVSDLLILPFALYESLENPLYRYDIFAINIVSVMLGFLYGSSTYTRYSHRRGRINSVI